MRILYILILSCIGLFSHGQALDSLKSVFGTQNGAEKATTLNELAWELAWDSPEEALAYASEALRLGRIAKDSVVIATAYNRIGLVQDYRGEYSEALINYGRALEISKLTHNQHYESGCLNNIGGVYYYLGSYGKALEYYLLSLTTRETLYEQTPTDELRKNIAQSFNNIALVYKMQKEYNKAIEYYAQSISIKRELGDSTGMNTSLMNLGVLYLDQDQIMNARACFFETLEYYRRITDTREIASSLTNLGLTYREPEKLDTALLLFRQAMELYDNAPYPTGESSALVGLAGVYNEQGNYEKAIDCATQIVTLGIEMGSPNIQLKGHELLTVSYIGKGNYESAYSHLFIAEKLEDSLMTAEKDRALLELSTIYETEKNLTQIASLSAEKETMLKEVDQKKKENVLLTIGAGMAILALSLTIVVLRQRKKRAEEHALNQIREYVLQIKVLESELGSHQDNHQPHSHLEINRYLMSPLTARELEVLNLIADGKSNKEICEALFVSINTVKTHVLRIYEKLDVQNRTQAAVRAGQLNLLPKE